MKVRAIRWTFLLSLLWGSLMVAQAQPASLDTAVAANNADPVTLIGEITALTDTDMVVGQETILLTAETIIIGNLELDALVFVLADMSDNGVLTAVHVEVIPDDDPNPHNTVSGFITALTDTEITVDNHTATITPNTEINGEIAVGTFVYLELLMTPNGGWEALYIEPINGGGYFEHIGHVESLTNEEVVVAGLPFVLTDDTIIEGQLALNAFVFVEAEIDDATGTFIALYIEVETYDFPPEIWVTGMLTDMTNDSITIGDVVALITADTQIADDVTIGAWVDMRGTITMNGDIVALTVELAQQNDTIEHMGPIDFIGDGALIIGGLEFTITEDTQIIGELVIGDWAYVQADIANDGAFVARFIEVTPNDQPHTITLIGLINDLTADSITIDGFVATITDQTEIVGEPQVGQLALLVANTDNNGNSGQALYIEAIDHEDPDVVTITGLVEDISPQMILVDGFMAEITDETVIVGEINIGDWVVLEAEGSPNGFYTARYIEPISQDMPIYHMGIVEALEETAVTVSGLTFTLNEETEIYGDLALGSWVFVMAEEADDGSFVAIYIEVANDNPTQIITLMGPITNLTDDAITIDDFTASITADTQIIGDLDVGTLVHLTAEIQPNGDIVAHVIEVVAGGYISYLGTVTQLTAEIMTVDGIDFLLTDETEINGDIALDSFVYIEAREEGNSEDGDIYVALYIELLENDNPAPPVDVIVGPIVDLTDNSLTVGNYEIAIVADTQIEGPLAIGNLVHVITMADDAGNLIALVIHVLEEGNSGVIESMTGTSLTIDGQTYALSGETEINGTVMMGEEAYVGAVTETDGSLTAYYVEVFAGSNTLYLPILRR